MQDEVQQYYGNKVRARVCGICIVDERILLINHTGITKTNFWSPPGGGLNFEEPAEAGVKREFLEETGLQIEVGDFLFACEFINPPLHAIELFFQVQPLTPTLRTGGDPETGSPSIIREVKYKSWAEVANIPHNELHGIFRFTDHPAEIGRLRGFFKL
ncbi:MAG TPA: NUDIX domain-containing protein [Cyclobacteriaceae bacterium]|jgi:8-oxo-dGTP diphosphatase|nr:NUDIX domain-containing protein [Cyclobacteriaceae bacterium]